MVNKAFISTKFMQKKQKNKQNSYLLLAFLQSGSVPELNMHKSKHFLPGQLVHSVDSEWLLFNANSATFQIYYGENKLIIKEMMMRSVFF